MICILKAHLKINKSNHSEELGEINYSAFFDNWACTRNTGFFLQIPPNSRKFHNRSELNTTTKVKFISITANKKTTQIKKPISHSRPPCLPVLTWRLTTKKVSTKNWSQRLTKPPSRSRVRVARYLIFKICCRYLF